MASCYHPAIKNVIDAHKKDIITVKKFNRLAKELQAILDKEDMNSHISYVYLGLDVDIHVTSMTEVAAAKRIFIAYGYSIVKRVTDGTSHKYHFKDECGDGFRLFVWFSHDTTAPCHLVPKGTYTTEHTEYEVVCEESINI